MHVLPPFILQAPFSPAEAQALAFADAWIQYAQEQLVENGSDFAPTIHFLPGEKLHLGHAHRMCDGAVMHRFPHAFKTLHTH